MAMYSVRYARTDFERTRPDRIQGAVRYGDRRHVDNAGLRYVQHGADGIVKLNESKNLRGLLEWARTCDGVEDIQLTGLHTAMDGGATGLLDVRFADGTNGHAAFASVTVMLEWVWARMARSPRMWGRAMLHGRSELVTRARPRPWQYAPDPTPARYDPRKHAAAESWAHMYACGTLTAAELKTALLHAGLVADLRAWTHNILHAECIGTGDAVDIHA